MHRAHRSPDRLDAPQRNATHVYGFNRGTAKGTGTYNASAGSVWRIAK